MMAAETREMRHRSVEGGDAVTRRREDAERV